MVKPSKIDDAAGLVEAATDATSQYDYALARAEAVFCDGFGKVLAPDFLRIVAMRLLEIAEEREPAGLSGQQSSRTAGWTLSRRIMVRDLRTFPAASLVARLFEEGFAMREIGEELAARGVRTINDRLIWESRTLAAIRDREVGRLPVWTGLSRLETL